MKKYAVLTCLWLLGSSVDTWAQNPRLFLPATVTVNAGENFTLPVRLTDGTGIRSLQFDLVFDTEAVRLMGSLPGTLLQQHGFSAVETAPGRVTVVTASGGDGVSTSR